MISPFDNFQKPEDVKPYIDDNEKLILPICDNIVFALGKSLDPLEDNLVSYDRNQATVLGVFVKQYQLFQSFVRASRGCDMAATLIFQRIIYEAYIKMRYLIKHGESAQKEYRLFSYKTRYKFFKTYKEDSNHIARILIEKFKADINNEDFSIEDIAEANANAKKLTAFGGKPFSQLVEEFDPKETYTSVYGYLSDAIHTDWGETRQLYLQETEDASFVYNPQKQIKIPARQLAIQAQLMLESSFVFIEWLESIGLKFDIIGIMKSFLKELQRVLSLVMVNIFEDYRTDKFLYE
ncbi:MAG: DUF5677 domain-containing protein [Prevotella sp.]|jgi:hypothetical protein|nr:DUF5677 domain-containing protein [Prevotella sp.]